MRKVGKMGVQAKLAECFIYILLIIQNKKLIACDLKRFVFRNWAIKFVILMLIQEV